MQPTPEQLAKLKDISYMKTDAEVVLYKTIDDSKTQIENKINEIETNLNDKLNTVASMIASIEIPEQIDDTNNFKALMSKIEEPMEISVELNIV